ncbi:8999_t:CDS:2 [Dentiscutata erythropus]|uniref:8999_t:CDS:1 n=1 Tax=Dentiscutata erythropus TaxID=1348616 RepID=A0A9N9DGY8_9GLOM|nr:8999_t:CDS:2 [Dentiscutata erythropus]
MATKSPVRCGIFMYCIFMFLYYADANTCSGSIQVRAMSDMEPIKSCKSFAGTILISSLPISDLVIPDIQSFEGTIDINSNENIRRISMPNLVSATRISISNQTMLSTLEFPSIQKIDTLTIKKLPSLTDLSFPTMLNETKNLEISETGARGILVLRVKKMSTLRVENNKLLEFLQAPNMKSVDTIYLTENGKGKFDFTAPYLNNVNDLTVKSVGSLSLPSLSTVSNNLVASENSFSSFTLQNLRSVTGGMTIDSNQNLKSTNFQELQTIGSSLVISNNPSLEKVNGFPKLERIGGSADITGSFSELEVSKLNEIKGGINVQTKSERFRCEEVDKFKNEGVVKGDTTVCLSGIKEPKSVLAQPQTGIPVNNKTVGGETNKGKATNTSSTGNKTLLHSDGAKHKINNFDVLCRIMIALIIVYNLYEI